VNVLNKNPTSFIATLLVGFSFLIISVASSAAQQSANNPALNGPNWQYFSKLEQAGFLLLDENERSLEAKNSQQYYVPASTTKLITALLSLQHWGADYRFKTEFYLDYSESTVPRLIVKGFGDPYLVSEELVLIANNLTAKLQQLGVHGLSGIQLDTSYYQPGLVMPGTGKSDNPYDAIPSALTANFNSINIKKQGRHFLSAESQTPMTETGLAIAKTVKGFKKKQQGFKKRVNLGNDVQLNERYFAELFTAFLKDEGLTVVGIYEGNTSTKRLNSQPVYIHYNSRTLAEVVRPMMKYSTNFIANQLALNLSVELLGGEANQHEVKQAYHQRLTENFGWQTFNIEDGAGLSRNNRLAPNQLIDVLQAFKPWMKLLPEIENRVYAKSGTLIGVSTLAGYIKKEQQLLPFAMMINQKVPYRFRNKLAKELAGAY